MPPPIRHPQTASTLVTPCRRLLAAFLAWAALSFGSAARATPLDHLEQLLRPHALAEQMRLVNLAINELEHAPTPAAWQTPAELLQRGAGDCKDLAYAKYWVLQRVAQGHRAMRLGYGQIHLEGRWQLHLVLLVWTDEGEPWVLDNVVQDIRRLSERPELALQFSFDQTRYYSGTGHQTLTGTRVKGWDALRERMAPPAPQATQLRFLPLRLAS